MSPPDDPVPTIHWVFKNQPMAYLILIQPSGYLRAKQKADCGQRKQVPNRGMQVVDRLVNYI